MSDTSLILHEMKLLREAMEDIRKSLPKRAKPRRKANPTLAEVEAYAKTRERSDLAKRFHSHYTEGKEPDEQWKNGGDKPIYNWKATFVQWENRSKGDAPTTNERSLWNEL